MRRCLVLVLCSLKTHGDGAVVRGRNDRLGADESKSEASIQKNLLPACQFDIVVPDSSKVGQTGDGDGCVLKVRGK
jgi:hypothetical protein